MRAEFKVSLKRTKLNYIRRDRSKLHREPILRQYLVLAHQVKEVLKTQPNRTMKEISGWIGYTPARMSQIMNLLFLIIYQKNIQKYHIIRIILLDVIIKGVFLTNFISA